MKGKVEARVQRMQIEVDNPLPRSLGSRLVSVGVSSSVCCGSIIGVIGLMEVGFALMFPRKLLAGVLGTIKTFVLPLCVSVSYHITMASTSSTAPMADAPPQAQAPYRRTVAGTEYSR